MAIRLKTVFFKNAGGRSTAETASVLASTIWRIADEVVTNLSKWDCDIVTPERGMKILGEMAAFLLHMADRMAYGRMPEPERARFIQVAGQRLGEIVQDNIRAMVGADGFDYKANFIDLLNRLRAPFNVNTLAQVAALAALDDDAHVERTRQVNREGMAYLREAFEGLGLECVPSWANFILVKVGNVARLYEALLRQGVIVRPVPVYGFPEHVRVTIGTRAENERLVGALARILHDEEGRRTAV